MIFIPSIRIGGTACGNDCTGTPCGEAPVDPCANPVGPVFDQTTGALLCGPVPDVSLGVLAANASGNATTISFIAYGANGAASLAWTPPSFQYVNCAANTSRVIAFDATYGFSGVNLGPSFVITVSGPGFSAALTRSSFSSFSNTAYVKCPFTTTVCPPNASVGSATFGTPTLRSYGSWSLSWTAPTQPNGGTNISISMRLVGYSA